MKRVNFHLKVPTSYLIHSFEVPQYEGWLLASQCKNNYNSGDAYSGWSMQLRLIGFPDWNENERTLHLHKIFQRDGSEVAYLLVHPTREAELRRIAREVWCGKTDLWEENFLENYPLLWKDFTDEEKRRLCKKWQVSPAFIEGEKIPNGPFVNYLDLHSHSNEETHENDTQL